MKNRALRAGMARKLAVMRRASFGLPWDRGACSPYTFHFPRVSSMNPIRPAGPPGRGKTTTAIAHRCSGDCRSCRLGPVPETSSCRSCETGCRGRWKSAAGVIWMYDDERRLVLACESAPGERQAFSKRSRRPGGLRAAFGRSPSKRGSVAARGRTGDCCATAFADHWGVFWASCSGKRRCRECLNSSSPAGSRAAGARRWLRFSKRSAEGRGPALDSRCGACPNERAGCRRGAPADNGRWLFSTA